MIEKLTVGSRRFALFLVAAPFLVLIALRPILPDWAITPPKSCLAGCANIDGIIPIVDIVNAIIDFLRKYEIFGLFTFKDITRAIADAIKVPLDLSEGLLHKGFTDIGVEPIAWVILVGLAAIFGWYLKGWRLALLGGGCFFYLALFSKRGIWDLSMQTLSAISVSAPLAGIIGLSLGILAAKSRRLEHVLWPILNVLQSLPHFSYLILVAIFFGVGSKAGVIATVIFAFPPMTRLTLLGIKGIPSEVIEAGTMAGCTPKQMLFKVELPSARSEIMLGVNQVIMQCLAMVVIASFIGQSGLGYDLLTRLQRLAIGQALEVGIAVVLIAIALDRFSQAMAEKAPTHLRHGAIWVRHPFISAAVALIVATLALSFVTPHVVRFPQELTISTSLFWDAVVDYITLNFYGPLGAFSRLFSGLFPDTGQKCHHFNSLDRYHSSGCVSWLAHGRVETGIACGFLCLVHRRLGILGPSNDHALHGCCITYDLRDDRHTNWYLGIKTRLVDQTCTESVRYLSDLSVIHLSASGCDAVPDQRCLGNFRHHHLCTDPDYPLYDFWIAQRSAPHHRSSNNIRLHGESNSVESQNADRDA